MKKNVFFFKYQNIFNMIYRVQASLFQFSFVRVVLLITNFQFESF